MKHGLVSAVITTHNRKELLLKAITSVLKQTYHSIECIVVDDASTDGTRQFIQKFIDAGSIQYIYIKSECSKGGNYARNIGINQAKGEYIAFCDDDDEWLSTKIEKQVNKMESNENVGFVYCGMIVEKDFNIHTRICRPNKIHEYYEGDLSKLILTRIITNTSTIMVKRSLLQRIGGFDENLKYWQEYELCIRILQEVQAGAVKDNLILYRNITKDKNRLSNKIKGWEESVKYIENKHKDFIETLTEEENDVRKMYIYIDGFLRGYNAQSGFYMLKYLKLTLRSKQIRRMIIHKAYKKIKNKVRKME